jgi:hypothetical protein
MLTLLVEQGQMVNLSRLWPRGGTREMSRPVGRSKRAIGAAICFPAEDFDDGRVLLKHQSCTTVIVHGSYAIRGQI